MPSSHRRIGLVVDEDVGTALALLRGRADSSFPDARLVREAVLDAILVERLVAAAELARDERAAAVVEELRALLPTLELPEAVLRHLMQTLDTASKPVTRDERRRRQLALIDSPNPYGRAALDYTNSVDAFDEAPR